MRIKKYETSLDPEKNNLKQYTSRALITLGFPSCNGRSISQLPHYLTRLIYRKLHEKSNVTDAYILPSIFILHRFLFDFPAI